MNDVDVETINDVNVETMDFKALYPTIKINYEEKDTNSKTFLPLSKILAQLLVERKKMQEKLQSNQSSDPLQYEFTKVQSLMYWQNLQKKKI